MPFYAIPLTFPYLLKKTNCGYFNADRAGRLKVAVVRSEVVYVLSKNHL